MHRRAFTLIELMIVIAIIAVIAAIAIPNLLDKKNRDKGFEAGRQATVISSGIQVTLLRHPNTESRQRNTDYQSWICRIDNGEGAVPRYSEVTFHANELRAILPKVER